MWSDEDVPALFRETVTCSATADAHAFLAALNEKPWP